MTTAGRGFLSRAGHREGFWTGPVSSARCGACHVEHYREWRRSFHARSLASEDFLNNFARYLEFRGAPRGDDPGVAMECLSCHAPVLNAAGEDAVYRVSTLALARDVENLDGYEVGCVGCHAEPSGAFSGPIARPQPNPFHASEFSPFYKEGAFCARCHAWTPSSIPCSDVYSDWQRSLAAKQGKTCQHCHMAERTGAAVAGGPERKLHSHVFPGARSDAMARQGVALGLKAGFRNDRLEVAVTARNLTPHRLPDG
ncbi:MAG TPA: multiheme c-type cytochrome [Candidatus Eisenbacteria bacterium]|nr:multiheme c-type cytochrome [Candidatus Eisenbacteria bacterium]